MPFSFQIPEPCHIPGYTGHVPQYKYHVGPSFSRATHDVIVDPVTPGSGRTVLTNYEIEVWTRNQMSVSALRGKILVFQ